MPKFPAIPQKEYETRLSNAQKVMKKHGLNALFLTEFENIFYMTGYENAAFATTRDWPYALIVKEDGAVSFVVRGGTEDVARETSWVPPKDIRGYRMIPDAGAEIKRAFGDLELEGAKVGAELGEVQAVKFSTGLFLDILKNSGAEFVDGAEALWDLRMVKSPFEVDCLRKSARIASKAAERTFEKLKVGMDEWDVSHLVGKYMFEEGAEPGWTSIVQSGEKFIMGLGGTFPSTRKIKKGEWVQIDWGALYHHYNSDLNRIALMGRQPTAAEKDHWALFAEANKKGTAAVRPGVTAADVFATMEKVFSEAGLKYPGVRAGHGLGLDGHEPPHLGFADKTVLKPGMVFAIEPYGVPNKNGLKFNCEDDVACTDTGSQRLTTIAREIFVA